MSNSKPYTLFRAFGFAAIVQMGFAATASADESCADAARAAASKQASLGDAACTDYKGCIEAGKQFLKGREPGKAIDAFKQALASAGDDDNKISNAYGCLGVAHEAAAEPAEAQTNLEKARSVSGRKLAWVEAEYKRLLSSQDLMTAGDIEKKLNADQEVKKEETLQTATAPDDSIDMGSTRGFEIATVEEPGKYTPKPQAGKSKPPAKAAKKPGHARSATRSVAADPSAFAPSLDLRINFAYNSAELTPEGTAQADELGKALEKMLQEGHRQAILIGHTDLIGSESQNERLSQSRAATVKAYLSEHFPSVASKLSERGMGMRQPLFREMDENTQRLNRRVEVKLIQIVE